jgi:hypothetical protein
MVKHSILSAAISAVALVGAASQAAAQCCATCDCGPGMVVEQVVVNQGPVFSGPGHYLAQTPDSKPRKYPYVGFVFSGYPYGYYDPYVGAPRRFYHPR